MSASEGTLRYYGQASVMLDKPTKLKLKAAAEAAGMGLAEYIRFMVDKSTHGQQGEMIPVTNTVASVKRDTSEIVNILRALIIPLKGNKATAEDIRLFNQSPFSDSSIKETYKETYAAIIAKTSSRGVLPDSSRPELNLNT